MQSTFARKEVNNIVYLLKGCRKSDTTVKCELVIMNKATERGLRILASGYGSPSTIVDSTGKSYVASSIDIGGQSHPHDRNIFIAPGIDYVAVLTFENVPEQVTKVPLLNVLSDERKIQFRNVSFSN